MQRCARGQPSPDAPFLALAAPGAGHQPQLSAQVSSQLATGPAGQTRGRFAPPVPSPFPAEPRPQPPCWPQGQAGSQVSQPRPTWLCRGDPKDSGRALCGALPPDTVAVWTAGDLHRVHTGASTRAVGRRSAKLPASRALDSATAGCLHPWACGGRGAPWAVHACFLPAGQLPATREARVAGSGSQATAEPAGQGA